MAELQPTDEFLVNRTDTTYTQTTDTLMASLETTDYLLVNRSDSTYKITGADFINSVIDPLEITVVVSPNPPLINEAATAQPVVTGGKEPDGGYSFTYQWHYADDLIGTNLVDIAGQQASTYSVPESDIGKFIGCTCTTTDALGTTASNTGFSGPVTSVEVAPVINEVVLTEIYDGANRYTGKEFPYTTVMALDGKPDPTYAVKAKLSGTTFDFAVNSDTITDVENTEVPAGGFSITLYTGNAATQDLKTGIDNTAKSLMWFKSRTSSYGHALVDTVRGNEYNLSTHNTNAEVYNLSASSQDVESFTDEGAVLGNRSGWTNGGNNTVDFVAWNFQAGEGFFDIVKYTGNSAVRDIQHDLKSAPGMMIIKRLNSTSTWSVYHSGIGNNQYLRLDETFYQAASTAWNNTTPSADNFTLSADFSVNKDADEYVAYLFADNPAAGIKCGKYLGDGTGGHFIETGFKVDWVMIKDVTGGSGTYGWYMFDRKRGSGDENVDAPGLLANDELPEAGKRVELGDNGFTLWEVGGLNLTDRDHIYIAIGERTGDIAGTQLTVATEKDLDKLTGDVFMTDGTVKQDGSGEFEPASYTPTTTNIASVSVTPPIGGFSSTLYTGNSGTQSITTGNDNTTESLVWIKNRTASASHYLFDTERLATNFLSSDSSNQQDTSTNSLETFTNDGFTLGSSGRTNTASEDYIAWNFKAGAGFFDIVTWESSDSPRSDIVLNHSLNSEVGMIIGKKLVNSNWYVYHKELGANEELRLNKDTAKSTETAPNFGAPTNTTFTVSADLNDTAIDGTKHDGVAYLFADNPDAGIKCGLFNGTGSQVSIDVGFKPGWVLYKRVDSSSSWMIWDTARPNGNASTDIATLLANDPKAEAVTSKVELTDTGFTIYDAGTPNELNGEYIYVAIAEGTGGNSQTELAFEASNDDLQYFKPGDAIEGSDTSATFALSPAFTTTLYAGNSSTQTIDTGIDNTGKSLVWIKDRDNNGGDPDHCLTDTVRGPNRQLFSNTSGSEAGSGNRVQGFTNDGFELGSNVMVNGGSNYVAWNFRAAPGFMDIVTWIGDNTPAQSVSHQLSTKPGMMIVKNYSSGSTSWTVYHKELGASYYGRLNDNSVFANDGTYWNSTEPTADEFTVGQANQTNSDGKEYVAYLFADTPGTIKCGSYTGNSSTPGVEISTGFKPGWVMIKSAKLAEDWLIFDRTRGVNGLIPNKDDAESDTYYSNAWSDLFEWTDTGFKVSSALGTINGANSPYIYVAIAEDAMAGEFAATAIVDEVDVDNNSMTLTNVSGDWTEQIGTVVEGPTNTAEGTISQITGTEIELSNVSGRWIADNNSDTAFSIAPVIPVTGTQNEAYAKLQIISDKAQVIGIQASDPGFVNVSNKDYSIKFPSLFSTGNDPDTDLPMGTAVSAIVKAENTAGTSVKESNALLPQLPNPEGAAGPITATTETELTVSSTLNLDTFIANDALVMVDDTGAVASYTPESSAIDTVVDVPGGWTSLKQDSGDWRAIVYAGGRFVAVGSGGDQRSMYSINGTDWTPVTCPLEGWYSLAYGNNTFVAVANTGSNRTMYSSNGTLWLEKAAANTSGRWGCVAFGEGVFLALAYSDGLTMKSTNNGASWSSGPVVDTNSWQDLIYADGKFVAVAAGGDRRVMYSTDKGNSWTYVDVPELNAFYSIAYGNGKFVAVAADGDYQAMWSTDAITWYSADPTPGGKLSWTRVTYGNGRFVAVGSGGTMYSDDGIKWNAGTPSGNNSWFSVAYGDSKFVAVATNKTDRVMYSATGNDASTTLTLTDAQDLNNFKAGDTVQGENATSTFGTETPAFSTTLYTGDRTERDIINGIDNTNKGLVWIKERSGARYHHLFDTARGVNNYLNSNTTNAASDGADTLPAFNSNGFTIGSTSGINATSSTYVSWNFRAAPGFMDIVTWIGDKVSGREIPHGLSSVPGMMIVKKVSQSGAWPVWHKSFPAADNAMVLNESGPIETQPAQFNSTAPTSTHLTVGDSPLTNDDGEDYVAYLFADTPGKIKCGTYKGTGGNPLLVETGFEPEFFFVKSSGGTDDWELHDNTRLTAEGGGDNNKPLQANRDYAESYKVPLEFVSNGIMLNTTSNGVNALNKDYIYIAIAKDAMAGEFPPTGELIEDADPAGPTITLTNTKGDWTELVGGTALGSAKSGVGTFVSTNGTDTITLENSNNEWCSIGRNGEEFFAIKEFTALNANDPKHVQMSQDIAAAFAAFPQNVNARRTSIASSFYRLMGGATLTAEETDRLTATVLTAVNAAEPFALDGYYPLYYTAAAANAASSVDDHHTHDMNGETFYMPDGGTIYHGNYEVPEETEEEEESSGY